MFAVFVTKLVAHRQELALEEVHRLTFEDIFHNTREDLFVIRKDFDAIMEEVQEKGELSPQSWSILATAYEQAQTLMQEIPEFYDNSEKGSYLYVIDAKREKLLLESVQRTLDRINLMLDTLSKAGINWIEHEKSMKELRELMKIIDETTPLWREYSPYEMHEAFEDIIRLKDVVHSWLQGVVPKDEN